MKTKNKRGKERKRARTVHRYHVRAKRGKEEVIEEKKIGRRRRRKKISAGQDREGRLRGKRNAQRIQHAGGRDRDKEGLS